MTAPLLDTHIWLCYADGRLSEIGSDARSRHSASVCCLWSRYRRGKHLAGYVRVPEL